MDLKIDGEILVTLDNEFDSEIIDCVVLTDKQIVTIANNNVKYIYYRDIEKVELPKQKVNSDSNYADIKRNLSDKAKLHLYDGNIVEIRIIYGGVYSLATALMNTKLKEENARI